MEVVDLNGLDELRTGIGGGWLEGVNLPPTAHCPGARLYCDEEFQFKPELEVNMRATMMGHAAGMMPSKDASLGGPRPAPRGARQARLGRHARMGEAD
jgi:hypothetical protein